MNEMEEVPADELPLDEQGDPLQPPPRVLLVEPMEPTAVESCTINSINTISTSIPFDAESPYLFHMIREGLPCSSVLSGVGTRSCHHVVQCALTHPILVQYQCPLTGRRPIHEAALQGSCGHIVRALLEIDPRHTVQTDNALDTPLHLLFRGLGRRRIEPDALHEIIQALLAPPIPPIELVNVAVNVVNAANAANATDTAATRSNQWGDLPLHAACLAPETMVPLCAVEALLQAHAAAAIQLNHAQQTPLHLHCQRRNASVLVAQRLTDTAQSNDYRCTRDSHGQSPLHYAAHTCNVELIRLLVAVDPTCASECTVPDQQTALHLLCLEHPDETCVPAVECLVEAAPFTASHCDGKRSSTPLHLLLNRRSSRTICAAVVQTLIRLAPECLAVPDADGYLPLHYAAAQCGSGIPVALLECILHAYPVAATIQTRQHDTALSLACTANVSPDAVRMLLDAYPEATSVANDYGFVPLHCVCRAQAPLVSVVQCLVHANPASVDQWTHAGEWPMHLAHGASRAVLALLTVEGGSETERARNKVGNTPLHYACLRSASLDSIEAMAESNPSWCLARNKAGYSPLQILCKNGRISEHIVTVFARLCGPKAFSAVDAMGNTPLHSAMRQETDVTALRALMRAYPGALQIKSQYNDSPLSLACLRNVDSNVVCEVAQETWLGADYGTARLSPLVLTNRAGQTPISIVMDEFLATSAQLPTHCRMAATTVEGVSPHDSSSFVLLSALVKLLHYGPKATSHQQDQSLMAACLALHRFNVRLDPNFIRWVLIVNPRDAAVPDDEGNYPLHLEAGIPVEKMTLLDSPVPCRTCGTRCYSRSHVLSTLMQLHPHAATVRNHNGDSPLGLMIRNGRGWDTTFSLVVQACPEALQEIGIGSLAPQVLAKVGHCCGTDTVYRLIRSSPGLVHPE